MGRIKTVLVKRITRSLFAQDSDRFTTDFSKNKKVIDEMTDVSSIKLRNIIAGYATRLAKQKAQSKIPERSLGATQ